MIIFLTVIAVFDGSFNVLFIWILSIINGKLWLLKSVKYYTISKFMRGQHLILEIDHI